MKEIELNLIEKHRDFWNEIYDIEEDEIKALKDYIDYIQTNLKCYRLANNSYKGVLSLFMHKHLEYLNEAFLSLSLKHYNSFAVCIRIIIENYVSFMLIKENKNKNLWKDWYLWSIYKSLKTIRSYPNCSREMYQKFEKNYESMCNRLGVTSDYITNCESYGWLKRVYNLNSYRFKNASDKIDKQIYKDFSYYSSYTHNNDMLSKINWVDMALLTKFVSALYKYTDKMIEAYNYHFTTRKEYCELCSKLYQAINRCKNYNEEFNFSN